MSDSNLLVDSDRHLQWIALTHPPHYTFAEYSIHDVFVDISVPRYSPNIATDEPDANKIQRTHTSHSRDIARKSRSSRSLRTVLTRHHAW